MSQWMTTQFLLYAMVFLHYLLGKLTDEWSLGDRVDDFSFNISTNNESPYYFFVFTSDPLGVIEDPEPKYARVNDTLETYTYRTKCAPTVSYRATVSVSLDCLDENRTLQLRYLPHY
eukprot:TRINITY_DN2453_c0_g1_i1.p1 TRINITY_DN2453_c0_g1~~TRINITY_DN2453_c0_g1_i1.p1  ORF type:complete len:117 (+),score=2.12 TRINITY_DN2453_c0_g1_i1:226-576(+)